MNKLKAIMLSGLLAYVLAAPTMADEQADSGTDRLSAGKAIAFDRNKGNCLSCHMMDDGELPGNSGPPLMLMQARYPDRHTLREQIYDARVRNPNTSMPPYGSHRILSEDELDLVVDYVHSL
jgi:sulfur-oxidizing protein SoxX